MKKLAIGAVCAAICLAWFSGAVEAALGVPGYAFAAAFVLGAIVLGARAMAASRSHAFDQRTTEGGFLN